MSEAHHSAAVPSHSQSHPVSVAVWVVVGAVALVVAIILLANFAIGVYGARSLEGSAAMTPEALARRIGPVAKLQVEGEASVAAAPAARAVAVAAVAPAGAGKADGKKVYDTACMACHATGAAGAPKAGDKAAWAPRLKAGNNALYASALKGKGAMPPKGGNAALGDAEVKAAVDYLLAQSR